MADRIALSGLQIAAGQRTLVQDASLTVPAGRVVGLVGPSGSGKTLTLRACMGLVDLRPGVVAGDLTITSGGHRWQPWAGLTAPSTRALDRAFRELRGDVLGYLPQDARAALDPLQTVGRQVAATAALAGDPRPDPLRWLQRAGLPDAEGVARLYPHELSGGMAQRVCIAQLLARRSHFLLADEPTTGLDPTVQQGLLVQLRELADQGVGILLVTHDLGLLQGFADEVVVMDGGRTVEVLSPDAMACGQATTPVARALLDATRDLAASWAPREAP